MFANYPGGVFPSKPLIKFEFVEENRHSDVALLGEVLEDIKKRTTGLIAERNRLLAENARLVERISDLETSLAECAQEKAEAAAWSAKQKGSGGGMGTFADLLKDVKLN